MSSIIKSKTSEQAVIKCHSLFKIFGDNPEMMLKKSNGIVNAKEFQDAGYVVGVNNASFEVFKH